MQLKVGCADKDASKLKYIKIYILYCWLAFVGHVLRPSSFFLDELIKRWSGPQWHSDLRGSCPTRGKFGPWKVESCLLLDQVSFYKISLALLGILLGILVC